MDSPVCQFRWADGRFGFCAGNVVAMLTAVTAGGERGTCWAHLEKVLRQMHREYEAGDFTITFIGREGRPVIGWQQYLERIME